MELVSPPIKDKTLETQKKAAILKRIQSPAPEFELCRILDESRRNTEKYIEEIFDSTYSAQVTEFFPHLLTMKCLGKLSGVAGMRLAGKNSLFLEQYLDNSIELELSEKFKSKISRDSIIEIGNLVATARGASHIVFLIFTSVLWEAGYQWITFSATQSLQNSLTKLGYVVFPICSAEPGRLIASSVNNWGKYYESNPVVVAGSLESAMDIIDHSPLFRRVKAHYKTTINALTKEFQKSVTDEG